MARPTTTMQTNVTAVKSKSARLMLAGIIVAFRNSPSYRCRRRVREQGLDLLCLPLTAIPLQTRSLCMPRIPEILLNAIAFLFSSRDAATAGMPGGTGFFVRDGGNRTFLVTNTHVSAQCSVVKINGTRGPLTIELDPLQWRRHPDGDDVSIYQFTPKADWSVSSIILADVLATRERMAELNVGVGDEIFMLGRFISHEDLVTVHPMARFGNIAMMPGQLVKDGRNLKVEAFLVEMRSLSGFSGSPVFVHIASGADRGNGTIMPFYSQTIGLIGIDAGHKRHRASVEGIGATDAFVQQNTGVAIVVPYYKIRELVDTVPL